tara:strand:- start:204 stop:590 length:387 start_codon:yes stop_codon:yes gene_type:complete
MVKVKTAGFNVLGDGDRGDFDKLFNEYFGRIQRKVSNISEMIFHLREYKKDGKREKFSLHTRIALPNKVIEADGFDWRFKKAVEKSFKKLEEEIEHRFHLKGHHGHRGKKASMAFGGESFEDLVSSFY